MSFIFDLNTIYYKINILHELQGDEDVLFKDRFSKNAKPLIFGNSLIMFILLAATVIPIIFCLTIMASGFEEILILILLILGVILITSLVLLFLSPFQLSAMYHSVHQVLIENKDITIKDVFQGGKKNYLRYLGYSLLLMLITGVVEVAFQILSLFNSLIGGVFSNISEVFGLLVIVILFSVLFILYMAFTLLASASAFKVEMSQSAVDGALFPILAWKNFKPTVMFALVIFGSGLLYFLTCIFTLGIGLLFQPLYIMFLYEQYLKYYHPQLLEDLYERHNLQNE